MILIISIIISVFIILNTISTIVYFSDYETDWKDYKETALEHLKNIRLMFKPCAVIIWVLSNIIVILSLLIYKGV